MIGFFRGTREREKIPASYPTLTCEISRGAKDVELPGGLVKFFLRSIVNEKIRNRYREG